MQKVADGPGIDETMFTRIRTVSLGRPPVGTLELVPAPGRVFDRTTTTAPGPPRPAVRRLPTEHRGAGERIAAGAEIRRAIDVVVAVLAVVVLAIPMAIIALLVVATSRGGVLFGQTRVGRDGDPITVYKFRSMCDGAHDLLHTDDELRNQYIANDFKLDGAVDPRITRVGRILRKTSLDELPQLWNVLRGDMSLVGIRPLLFEELAIRPRHDQNLYRLLRPGMTGLWQVRGRSSVEAGDRIALDREYVEDWSIAGDLEILCRTPLAVLRISQTH